MPLMADVLASFDTSKANVLRLRHTHPMCQSHTVQPTNPILVSAKQRHLPSIVTALERGPE